MPRAADRVELEPTADPARWAAACRSSEAPVTPFHSYPFLTLAARMTGTTFTALIVRHGGRDVGVAPWLVHSRGPLAVVDRMPFPYAGPLAPAAVLPATFGALLRRARRARAVVQEYQLPPGAELGPVEALPARFEVSYDRTFVIDTSRCEDELRSALKRTARQQIDKAARTGIEVVESSNRARVIAEVERAAVARKRLEIPYPHHFPPPVEELNRDGLEAHWVVARQGDEDLGSLIFLRFGDHVCMWVGGIHPAHRATHANVAIYWDGIRWAAQRGARTFDMVGLPDPGIERFKKQFGGMLHEYPVLRAWAPGWRNLQALDRRARRRVDALRSRRDNAEPSTAPI